MCNDQGGTFLTALLVRLLLTGCSALTMTVQRMKSRGLIMLKKMLGELDNDVTTGYMLYHDFYNLQYWTSCYNLANSSLHSLLPCSHIVWDLYCWFLESLTHKSCRL